MKHPPKINYLNQTCGNRGENNKTNMYREKYKKWNIKNN